LGPDHRPCATFFGSVYAAPAVIPSPRAPFLVGADLVCGPAVDERGRPAGEQAAEGLTEGAGRALGSAPVASKTGTPARGGPPAGVALESGFEEQPSDAEGRYFSLTPVPGVRK